MVTFGIVWEIKAVILVCFGASEQSFFLRQAFEFSCRLEPGLIDYFITKMLLQTEVVECIVSSHCFSLVFFWIFTLSHFCLVWPIESNLNLGGENHSLASENIEHMVEGNCIKLHCFFPPASPKFYMHISNMLISFNSFWLVYLSLLETVKAFL